MVAKFKVYECVLINIEIDITPSFFINIIHITTKKKRAVTLKIIAE
jgi:hypothetical protein